MEKAWKKCRADDLELDRGLTLVLIAVIVFSSRGKTLKAGHNHGVTIFISNVCEW